MANENVLNVRLKADLEELTSTMNAGVVVIKNFGKNTKAAVSDVQKSLNSFSGVGGNIVKNFDEIAAGSAVLSKINTSIDAAAASALSSGSSFDSFGKKVSAAIAQLSAGGANITQVTAAINEAAAAALRAGDGFLAIGVKVPIQDINILRANVNQLKADLASGFKTSISIVDPKTPALLNSISASLTNIAPAISSSNAALQGASNSAKVFAVSVNKSLSDALRQFNSFKTEALSLGTVFNNIPITLRPDTKSAVNELRQSVSLLKSEIKSVNLVIPPLVIAPPNLEAVKASFQQLGQLVSTAISQIGSGGAGIVQVTAAINQVAIAAKNAGEGFLAMGTANPIAEIDQLKNNVIQLKKELETGFKPIVSIVDPSVPGLLNSFSASLTNMSPAVQEARIAFKNGAVDIKAFVGSVDTGLAEAIKSFDHFKTEALELGNAFDKIPSALKPINAGSIVVLRTAVAGLKKDLTGFRPIPNLIPPSLPAVVNNTGKSLANLKNSSGAANNALTNIGRVLQDLPFGFVAIQNNITQLPGAFKALSLAAKESGQSMTKVLLSSLTGAGGIGIAISAVTAAVTFASVGFGSWSKIMGDTGKKAKEAADKTKEFVDSLKSIGQIRIESAGSVQGEISKVNALTAAVQDETKSQVERGRALSALKQINKEHFGDIELTTAGMARLTAATNEYTRSLVAEAVVAGFADEIKRVSTELRSQNAELDKARDKMERLQKVSDKVKVQTGPIISSGLGLSATVNTDEQLRSVGATKAASDEFNKQRDVVEKLEGSFAGLQGAMQGAVDETLKFKAVNTFKEGSEGAKKEDAQLKSLKNNLEGFRKELAIVNELRKEGILPTFREADALKLQEDILRTLSAIDTREVELKIKPKLEIDPTLSDLQLKKFTDEFGSNISSEINIPLIPQPVLNDRGFFKKLQSAVDANLAANQLAGIDLNLPITIDLTTESNITKQFDQLLPVGFNQPMIDKLSLAGRAAGESYGVSLSQALRDITSTGIADSIAALGEGLGAALTSGESPILSAAKSFLSVIGSVLQQVGKEIIVASKLVIALKAALAKAFTNPAASLVAGIALVIAGAALKNIKFPKLAQGGITTGPTIAMIGENGREAVIPLNRGGDFFNEGSQEVFVHGEIHGDVIKLIYDKASKSQRRRF